MFCTKCGKEIPNNVKFCTSCGKQIEEDLTYKIVQKKKTSKGLLITGSIATTCLLAVGACFTYIYFVDTENGTSVQTSCTTTEDEHKENTAPTDTEKIESVDTVIEVQTGTENGEEGISHRGDELDKDSNDAESVKINFDIEKEVLVIREKYNTFQDNMENYSEPMSFT